MRIEVLLVDDEEDFSAALAERLILIGFKVNMAYTGEQALAMIERETPHVVILDIVMPGLNGLEILKRIKALKYQTQVILITGAGSAREGIEGMYNGAFDYLMKPIPLDDLVSTIFQAARVAGQGA